MSRSISMRSNSISLGEYGMYGDLVLAPARSVVRHPAKVSWEEAAATWMQFTRAWAGLRRSERRDDAHGIAAGKAAYAGTYGVDLTGRFITRLAG